MTAPTGQPSAPGSVADLVLARAGEDRPGLLFEDRVWTWDEYVRGCARRARALRDLRREGEPFHVAVLLENVPDFVMLLGGAALAGATLVGLNPTRRGVDLARDMAVTDCSALVTDAALADRLLGGVDLPVRPQDRHLVDDDEWLARLDASGDDPEALVGVSDDDLFMLIFTSGTSGEPKAVRCTHRKVVVPGRTVTGLLELTPDDRGYLSMPLFHSAAVMAGWATSVASGAGFVLKRRFSASQFLPDVRRHHCTWFNYVGKPLAYVLATPERPDDADNPLRVAIGNEGAYADVVAFQERFGVRIVEGYGATESGVNIVLTPESPPNSLGPLPEGVAVLDPDTGRPCPVADLDEHGRLRNVEAIGELVNVTGAGGFAGYYGDDDAEQARLAGGMYHTGDLAYVDARGYVYFAGRTADWLRVDGENLAAAPIERVLAGYPDVALVAVYAVPNPHVGDDVMAAVAPRDPHRFDARDFLEFVRARPDLGTKALPRYVRVAPALPQTATNKVLKRELAAQRWECDDEVWFRPERDDEYRRLTRADVQALNDAFRSRGRGHVLR